MGKKQFSNLSEIEIKNLEKIEELFKLAEDTSNPEKFISVYQNTYGLKEELHDYIFYKLVISNNISVMLYIRDKKIVINNINQSIAIAHNNGLIEIHNILKEIKSRELKKEEEQMAIAAKTEDRDNLGIKYTELYTAIKNGNEDTADAIYEEIKDRIKATQECINAC